MLLMLVSLTAVCQYPMTKKFNGTDVVIMTTKQAEDINNKFLKMKDSITQFNNNLNGCITSLYFTQNKLEIALDSLSKIDQTLRLTMNNYNTRTKEYNELRQDFIKVNKNHRENTIGLLVATGLFTSILLILAGK